MSYVDRELAKEAADAVVYAFTWEDTEEGYEYWHGVYSKLIAIAEPGGERVRTPVGDALEALRTAVNKLESAIFSSSYV